MLLYKKQIKPAIKSYCLLRADEQTGMSFSLLANIKPHLYLVSRLQTQSGAVGTCVYFSADRPSPLAQLVTYVTTSYPRSCQSTAELHFWRRKAVSIKAGERILNESCTQLFASCETHETRKLILRLWVFCWQKNEVLDHTVLHFWCCILVRDERA